MTTTTLSDARQNVWFWTVFALLGIVLGAIGWIRWFIA
jgi:hypothetical protein